MTELLTKANLLTNDDLALLSACTGFLFTGDFDAVHKKVEERLGRPVFTHEFALEDTIKEVRDKSRDEYKAILDKMQRQANA